MLPLPLPPGARVQPGGGRPLRLPPVDPYLHVAATRGWPSPSSGTGFVMDIAAPAADARKHGHRIGRSRGFCWFARAGIAARGVVYIVIGVLALKLALGDGGKAADQQGALHTIAKQPLRHVLLVLVAIGLAGYASWRLLRAALGGTQGADDLKDRIDGVASGISYAILFVAAVKILVGSGGGGSDPDKTAGGVLGWPGGPWIVGLAGVIVIGVGLQQGYKGISRSFMEKTDTTRMHDHVERGYTALRRVRPPGADGRLRADRLLPRQGSDRLRPRQGGRARRRAGQAREGARTAPCCSGSSPRA